MARDPETLTAGEAISAEPELARLQRSVALLRARVRMLEDENHALVRLLHERGVTVHESSRLRLELPAAVTTPLDPSAAAGRLAPAERALLAELCGSAPVFVLVKSHTHVDVGHWFSNGLIWLAAGAAELALFAAGKHPHAEKVPYEELYLSLYNHVTGELVLAPAPEVAQRHLKLAPADAYQVLAQIYQGAGDADLRH